MIKRIGKQAGLILAVAGAAVVGGATTALVSAAIPSNIDGEVHGCYRNNAGLTVPKGNLRVIDTDASEACTSGETAVAWGKNELVDNLVGANFNDASLPNRDFRGMDLRNTHWVGANLNGTDFRGANLSGTNTLLMPLFAEKANFSDVNLSNATFKPGNGNGSELGEMNFQDANFDNVQMLIGARDSNFTNVDFGSVTFDPNISEIRFRSNNFTNADFSGLNVTGFGTFYFTTSNLTNANFSGVSFNAVGMRENDATNTNFTNAQFIDVSFDDTNLSTANLTGVTWSNVTCPDGTNSDNNSNTCIGHLVP